MGRRCTRSPCVFFHHILGYRLTSNISPFSVRWDPNREDKRFFNQSAALFSAYYHLQIVIHRPFIPSPRRPSPLSFPSLAICTNAARSCSHVLDIQRRRTGLPLPPLQARIP